MMKESYGSEKTFREILPHISMLAEQIGPEERALLTRSPYSQTYQRVKELAAIAVRNKNDLYQTYGVYGYERPLAAGLACAQFVHPSQDFVSPLIEQHSETIAGYAVRGDSWNMAILGQFAGRERGNERIVADILSVALHNTDTAQIDMPLNIMTATVPKYKQYNTLLHIGKAVYSRLGQDIYILDKIENPKYEDHSIVLLKQTIRSMLELAKIDSIEQIRQSCGVVNVGKTDIKTLLYADQAMRTISKHKFSVLYITPQIHADLSANLATSVLQQTIKAREEGDDAQFYYYEFQNASDLDAVLHRISQHTTTQLLVIADGHGTAHSFGNIQEPQILEIFSHITEMPTTVLFNSCSTGVKANGLAKQLSTVVQETAGPNIPTSATSIEIQFLHDEIFTILHFKSGKTRRYYKKHFIH